MSTNRRAAIYARFSTDLQNERSVEDQIAVCRALAEREGIEVVSVHHDAARSGASIFGRNGLITLIAQSELLPCPFDTVLVEHADRLSRDMEDLSGLHKRFAFRGIEIRAVNSGTMDTAMVGLFGLVGQMQREEGAKKTKRGLSGVVRSGRSAGGRLYGYSPVPGKPGELAIAEDEAAIVRRIFAAYLAGQTPREIAHALNRDGVAAPRGARWNASTINGNTKRGNGLLQTELFAGRRVWNKVSMLRDPSTGKRVSRPNPPDQWQSAEVPDLAIVDAETFAAAQARKAARAVHWTNPLLRKPRHLLSGLLRCRCGSGMSSHGKDRTGRTRLRCTAATESGSCPDPRMFYLDNVEEKVLGALRAEMNDPAVMTEFIAEYQAERMRLAARRNKNRSRLERNLAQAARELQRVINLMVASEGDVPELMAQAKDLSARKKIAEDALASAPGEVKVITLHPTALARYEQMLTRLQDGLSKGMGANDTEAAAALRDLVTHIIVGPGTNKGEVEVQIFGRLNALMGGNDGGSLRVGSGGNGPSLPSER